MTPALRADVEVDLMRFDSCLLDVFDCLNVNVWCLAIAMIRLSDEDCLWSCLNQNCLRALLEFESTESAGINCTGTGRRAKCGGHRGVPSPFPAFPACGVSEFAFE